MSERISAARAAFDASAHAAIVEHRRFTATIHRPTGVKAVAVFQVLKGLALMGTALLLHWRPDIVAEARTTLYPILYISTRGNPSVIDSAMHGTKLVSGLLFAFGFYLCVVGSALWRLSRWARRTVMVTCSITLLLWLRTKLSTGFFVPLGTDDPTQNINSFHVLLLLDGLVFLYLVRTKIGSRFRAY